MKLSRRCSSTEEWITKTWYIDTTELYSGVKNKDIRNLEGKWMKPEKKNILSEVTQTKKDNHGV